MKDQLTATIIPFPVRNRLVQAAAQSPVQRPAPVQHADPVPAPAMAAVPSRPQVNDLAQSSKRLTQALASLSAALADQKDATRQWKAAIEDLAAKMQTLGDVGLSKKKIS